MSALDPHATAPSDLDRGPSSDAADLAEMLASVPQADLGARIKKARRGRGLTQGAVAKDVISTAYLSRIETGERRPDLKVLRQLAPRLGTTPHELLMGLTPKEWSARQVEIDWAELALRMGSPEKALAETTAIVSSVPRGSRLYRRAQAVHAHALEANGDYEQAAAHLEEIIENETEGTPMLKAWNLLCRCYRQAGELNRAIEVGSRAVRYIVELDMEGTPEAVQLSLTVAAAHCESGDVSYAARLCQRALQHADSLDDPVSRARCYWNASIIESRRNNHDEALELAQRASFILDTAESGRNAAMLRTQLGILMLRTSPPKVSEALEHLGVAETNLRSSDANPYDLATNYLAQTRAHFLRGDYGRAQRQAEQCLREGATNAPLIAAEASVLLGQIAFKRGDVSQAQHHYSSAILALSGIGADRSAAQLWYELGSLWQSVDRPREALDAFKRAGASTGLAPLNVGVLT